MIDDSVEFYILNVKGEIISQVSLEEKADLDCSGIKNHFILSF
jgi:hypothetical protein